MMMPKGRNDDPAGLKLAASDRVVLIAGGGALPLEVAAGIRQSGHDPYIVEIEGEDVSDSRFTGYQHVCLPLEDFPNLIPILKDRRATHVVMAGSVARRPRIRKLRWNFRLLTMLARFVVPLARGDNQLLATIVDYIEGHGVKVVGAHEIVPDLLAPPGPMTKAAPLTADKRDILAATRAARAIGALDIGQAAVSVGGRVIAVEGIEGTDGLLARVRELRHHGRIAGKKRGVLVKCTKPGQELRADLPTIGLETVEAAHRAGLSGIAVEAGRSFVLDYRRTVDRADELGLFVLGLERDAG